MNAPDTIIVPQAVEFAREQLAGKLMQTCVAQLESLRTPWNMTTEANQQIALNKMRENVEKAVREAVMVIATDRQPHLKATVESVTFKDGIKCVLSVDRSNPMRHDLADAEGGTIIVTIARPETYTTGAEKVTAAPDQTGLPLEGPEGPTIPEIKENEDGTFTIYKDGAPMPGGKGFDSHHDAETWLQKTLGISIHKPHEAPAPTDGSAPDTTEGGEAIDPPGGTQEPDIDPPAGAPPAEIPKIEDAEAAFKKAGLEEARKGTQRDWDAAFNRASASFPPEFVDDFFKELDAAFADGWEEGSKE